MKRILAFILLLSHVNTSMLLPQVPEVDVYDSAGNQLDDVNSIVELVLVKLGIDHTADDEDNDSGQNLHVVADFQYTFQPFFSIIPKDYSIADDNRFIEYSVSKIPLISYDILVPPPKA